MIRKKIIAWERNFKTVLRAMVRDKPSQSVSLLIFMVSFSLSLNILRVWLLMTLILAFDHLNTFTVKVKLWFLAHSVGITEVLHC